LAAFASSQPEYDLQDFAEINLMLFNAWKSEYLNADFINNNFQGSGHYTQVENILFKISLHCKSAFLNNFHFKLCDRCKVVKLIKKAVWQSTSEVGCGLRTCSKMVGFSYSVSNIGFLLVCRYHPP